MLGRLALRPGVGSSPSFLWLFLPAIGISISFWPLAALRGFLAGFDGLAGSAPPSRITAKSIMADFAVGRR